MIVRGKSLLGPIFGIVGSILLLVAAFNAFGIQAIRENYLNSFGDTWESIGFDPMLFTASAVLTLIWALLGLIGALLSLMGKKLGVYLMLIFGIIASVGMFIPIGTYEIISVQYAVFLNSHLVFADPFLLLLGGIIGLIFKE
jgi:hypothetical protein